MGRKLLKDEVTITNVINLSWATISQALRSEKLDEKEKRVIALEVVKKTCPQKLDLGGDAFNSLAAVFGVFAKNQNEKK